MGSSYATYTVQRPVTGPARRRPATQVWPPRLVFAPQLNSIDQSTIIQVYPPVQGRGQAYVRWESIAQPGTWWQVYFDGVRVWSGQTTAVELPIPIAGVSRVDVGSVPDGYQNTSFAANLPPAPLRRATLNWTGGTSLGADLAGFYVYGSSSPNGSINYATPLATITAYPQSIVPSGTLNYSWVSGSLISGLWQYAVIPFDAAGNQGAPSLVTVTIAVPPLAPAPSSSGTPRLQYSYSQSSQVAVLNWLPSPSQ
jgi:hypothetical protein